MNLRQETLRINNKPISVLCHCGGKKKYIGIQDQTDRFVGFLAYEVQDRIWEELKKLHRVVYSRKKVIGKHKVSVSIKELRLMNSMCSELNERVMTDVGQWVKDTLKTMGKQKGETFRCINKKNNR